MLNTFVGLWNGLDTNRKVGISFPQNADGETWGNDVCCLPVPTRAAGSDVTVADAFQPRASDYSAQISAVRTAAAILLAAALLFRSGIKAQDDLGDGMASEVWWTPAFPFKSTLTGENSRDIAGVWEKETSRQWTQPFGYSQAIWEVAPDILKRSTDPLDRTANRDALRATNLTNLIGPVNFSTGPHPNLSTSPILGGQGVKAEYWKYDLKIVDNPVNMLFEPQQNMKPIRWA